MDPKETPSTHVLVVDDDAGFREQITAYLSDHGFVAEGADGGAEMDLMLECNDFDIVVLDYRMPGEDGLSICRRLATRGGPPVVMLSARGDDTDRIVGLELGADDYIAKPCNPRELLARLRAVLRRRRERGAENIPALSYAFAGASLDVTRLRLNGPNGATICLTEGELSLLKAFMAHPNRILTREMLLEYASIAGSKSSSRTVDVQISRLRRKLNACVDHELIITHRGAGYQFDATPTRR